jgi:predicted acyltransferase (DUF342 family)
MLRFFALLAFCALATVLLPPLTFAAEPNAERFQINRDIHIQPDDSVGDVTCINCSVHVRGRVSGDVTTIHGNISAEQGASIDGDVTAIGGNVRLENGARVAGDLTAIGGTARRDPQASVAGDVTNMGGGGWIFLFFLLPVAFLGGIIALIVWLVRRSRGPVPISAHAVRRN